MNNELETKKVTKSGLFIIALGALFFFAVILFTDYKFNPYSSADNRVGMLITFAFCLVFIAAIVYISLKIRPKDVPWLKKESELAKVDGSKVMWISVFWGILFVIAGVFAIYEGFKNGQNFYIASGMILFAFVAIGGWAFYKAYNFSHRKK